MSGGVTIDVDPDDPCGVLRELRKARIRLAMGAQEIRLRTREGDVEQEVMYAPAKTADLDGLIRKYEELCPEEARGRRFAIMGGSRRGR